MGYKKRQSLKVIKTEHLVRIDRGFSLTGWDFKYMFGKVPDNAILKDIDWDEDENWTEYKFLEEISDSAVEEQRP